MNNSWRGYGRRQDAAVRIEDIDELPLPAEDWAPTTGSGRAGAQNCSKDRPRRQESSSSIASIVWELVSAWPPLSRSNRQPCRVHTRYRSSSTQP